MIVTALCSDRYEVCKFTTLKVLFAHILCVKSSMYLAVVDPCLTCSELSRKACRDSEVRTGCY